MNMDIAVVSFKATRSIAITRSTPQVHVQSKDAIITKKISVRGHRLNGKRRDKNSRRL